MILQFFSEKRGQLLLAFFHLTLAVVSLIYTVIRYDDSLIEVTLPRAVRLGIPCNELWFKVSLFLLLSLFSFITTIAHILYYIYNERLLSLEFRWIEYAISAPLMLVIITLLTGIKDFYTLLTIFGLTSTTMTFGMYGDFYYMSKIEAKYVNPIFEGFWPYIFAWIPPMVQFFRNVAGAPAWVVSIIFTMFFFFTSFAFVQMYFVWWNKNSTTTLDEVYLRKYDGSMHLLSLVSKGLLTGLVLGGILNM